MQSRRDTSFFWLQRVHAAVGVVPLTAYYLLMLALYSLAIGGAAPFDRAMGIVRAFPLTTPLEVVFVGLPLVFYALMGLVLVYRSSANVVAYGAYRNWIYFLWRLTGLAALVVVVYNVGSTRIVLAARGQIVTFEFMRQHLAPLWAKVFYMVGIVAIAFHLSMGCADMLTTWGITQSRRSQYAAQIAAWIMTVVLTLWGMWILLSFIGR